MVKRKGYLYFSNFDKKAKIFLKLTFKFDNSENRFTVTIKSPVRCVRSCRNFKDFFLLENANNLSFVTASK